MAVTLKNKRRRLATFNLEAAFFKKRTGATRYGQPEVMTFLPLETKADLPDAILGCAEIQGAIKRGDLRNMTPAQPSAQVQAAQPAAAEDKKPKAGKGKAAE